MCRFLLAVVAAGGCLASHERAVHAHTPTPVAKDVRVTTLANGLRVVQPMTLMSTGLYNEPAGAWLPSVLF